MLDGYLCVINDMKLWETKHLAIISEFLKDNFVINKSNKPFSCMGIDQAHEQNNKLVKIDGGAVEILLNDSAALMKWMVAGLEIADMVQVFRGNKSSQCEHRHHEDSASFEKKFRKDVTKMMEVMRQLGNPFDDSENQLIQIVSRTIMNEESTNSVLNTKDPGISQYQSYVYDRLVICKKAIKEKIEKNNLSLFREKHKLSLKKDKMKVVSRKQENNLYASLFVTCQLRNVDLENFFQHENHCYPPSYLRIW